MEHRIRSAAIIVEGDAILLVKHQHPRTGEIWWVPPGGGLEHPESIYDCARRETYEETGLSVELGDITYVREFIDTEFHERPRHMIEVFIMATSHGGRVTIENVVTGDPDADYIKDARFLSRTEMDGLTVYPEVLKTNAFWEGLERGKITTTYLGMQWAGQ